MPPLIICGLLFLAFICVLLIKRSFISSINDLRDSIESIGKLDKELAFKNSNVESEITSLNLILSKTVNVYEAARDICTSLLDEEDFFKKFKENLKNMIAYSDCLLLAPGQKLDTRESSGNAVVFPLSVKENHLGALVIKDVSEKDRPYLGILAGQFALGLQRTRLYQMIQELAITDSLTGLYTRRYCLERLREEFERSRAHNLNLTVIMIDADDFKNCNDKMGHLVGDNVLLEIGNRIKSSIREVDMLSRFGGEEFMIFAPNTSKDMAFIIAQRILNSVRETPIRSYDETVNMTVSIGLASYPVDAKNPEDIIGKADWSLYQAKRMGKNRVCVFGAYYD